MPELDQEPQKPLKEKDFIHEEYSKHPFPFWLWFCLITVFVVLMWGVRGWFAGEIAEKVEESPFLQVTNRQISLFLWQFPGHMRANVPRKTGYLPAFQYLDMMVVEPNLADQFVQAPPDLIFLYHTWHRLLWDEIPERLSIPSKEFKEFLDYDEEWKPEYWSNAPAAYKDYIKSELPKNDETINLASLPQSTLPKEVRIAFQGWKNYVDESDQIQAIQPTFEQMQEFLSAYPHYARNYWRNILLESSPRYLYTIMFGHFEPASYIPVDEITPFFLKAAFYNWSLKDKVQQKPKLITRDNPTGTRGLPYLYPFFCPEARRATYYSPGFRCGQCHQLKEIYIPFFDS